MVWIIENILALKDVFPQVDSNPRENLHRQKAHCTNAAFQAMPKQLTFDNKWSQPKWQYYKSFLSSHNYIELGSF